MSVYLDYASGAPLRPEVARLYAEQAGLGGNPSSFHAAGRRRRAQFESARLSAARSLLAKEEQLTFTSGGTESINTALKGLYALRPGKIMLATRAEHPATRKSLAYLQSLGGKIFWLEIDRRAMLDPQTLRRAIETLGAQNLAFFTTLWVNNELGSVQRVSELLEISAEYDLPAHVDAVAGVGHVEIDYAGLLERGCVLLSLSGHKLGGPVSSGALLAPEDLDLPQLIHGGAQQRLRSGSLDPLAASALALALDAAVIEDSLAGLKSRLIEILLAVSGVVINSPKEGSEAIVSATFLGCGNETLLYLFDEADICVSAGSACSSGVGRASAVLLAAGFFPAEANSTVRFSLGFGSSDSDLDYLENRLYGIVTKARAAS